MCDPDVCQVGTSRKEHTVVGKNATVADKECKQADGKHRERRKSFKNARVNCEP